VRLAAQEARRLGLGPLEDLSHPVTGLVHGAQIGARLAERPRHRIAHLVRYLRAPGGVEKREALLQRGEALPERGYV
jgi:hypothetical protein